MFRQSKRRISSRRNFDDQSGSPSGTFILSGTTSEEEKQLYDSLYQSKLSFYISPPKGEITLEQFELWAIDRLKVLLEVESCIQRNKSAKEMELIIKPLLQKLLPFTTDDLESRKKDYYSHFILRLCFCRSKELRDKFVRSETTLLRLRFNMLTSQDQAQFVKTLDLPFLQFISDQEKEELSTELYQTVSSALQFQLNLTDETQRRNYFNQEKFIKLPFESVADLVGSRQVFIKKGFAYLPQFQQLNHIANEFSNMLSTALIKTSQNIPRLNEDDRLLPILHHLSSGYDASNFLQQDQYGQASQGEVNSTSVYSAKIVENFPLCAKNLINGLRTTHHLRYQARQQLSFFLKGIGMSVDDALQFWSDAFSGGGITTEKFNKEYRYNFRHNYGLEGNRINYKPWDCRTILSKPRPSRGEFHGCPYRDWNVEKLTLELSQGMNLTPVQVTSVLDNVQRTEYTVACTKVFEMTHGGSTNVEVNDQTHISHPNLYYERSRQLQKKSESTSSQ
ncbi:LAME_0G14510g1_1 [Lachancea meyersii CBS 8951]|uniref:DNA primase large subunit n=1 Tax=Lachancea meyersii CBS 8951 TaxID=1266667 RepID=A0A1G4KAH0_9SACH|nr:LAME_0G14510g1_1 [Lachancea meyersii CBS 8951]